MHKVAKVVGIVSATGCVIYALARKLKRTGCALHNPVRTKYININTQLLMGTPCPLDYPCPIGCEESLECKLLAYLYAFDEVRCDQIISHRYETCWGTHSVFAVTANAKYEVFFNPANNQLSMAKYKRR